MKSKVAIHRFAILAALALCCWVLVPLFADSPVVNRQVLHRSLKAGLVGDCLRLIERQPKYVETFLQPSSCPPSIALLKPDKVLVTERGVSICLWAAGHDKLQQSTTIHICPSDKPPCSPSNPIGLEYCEKVANQVFIRYCPAQLKDGDVSLITEMRAHFQKGTFKFNNR